MSHKKFESVLLQAVTGTMKAQEKVEGARESVQSVFTEAVRKWYNDGAELDNNTFAMAAHEVRNKCLEADKDGKEKMSEYGNKVMSKTRKQLVRACEALRDELGLEQAITIKHTKDRGYFVEWKDFPAGKSDELLEAVKAFKKEPTDTNLRDKLHSLIDTVSHDALIKLADATAKAA